MKPSVEEQRRKEAAQRRLDAKVLLRESAFRRLAWWLVRPVYKNPHGPSDRDSAFKSGQWQSADELRRLLRDADLDAFQRMEREGEAAGVLLADSPQGRADSSA